MMKKNIMLGEKGGREDLGGVVGRSKNMTKINCMKFSKKQKH